MRLSTAGGEPARTDGLAGDSRAVVGCASRCDVGRCSAFSGGGGGGGGGDGKGAASSSTGRYTESRSSSLREGEPFIVCDAAVSGSLSVTEFRGSVADSVPASAVEVGNPGTARSSSFGPWPARGSWVSGAGRKGYDRGVGGSSEATSAGSSDTLGRSDLPSRGT